MASWAPKTRTNYECYIKKWKIYCSDNSISNPYSATYEQAMSFLADLFHKENCKYGVTAVARSALSAILPKHEGKTFGEHPDVSKMLRGIFKLRPMFPKYTVIYDPDIVLNYMKSIPDNSCLMLEQLIKKLCTLLCLLSGQRCQTISFLDLKYSHLSHGKYTFAINQILKTSKPGKHQPPLEYCTYPENGKLCVVACLTEYKKRTELIRENLEGQPTQLILSYAYPHEPVGSATVARYVKLFLGQSGIDLTVFSAHSTRSASTSKGNNLGLNIDDIRKAGGWKSESTFRKFYNLPIHRNLGKTLLQGNKDS